MFRSSTILRELVQCLDKIIFLLKHSVKLRRILRGDVAACLGTVCVHTVSINVLSLMSEQYIDSIMHGATIKITAKMLNSSLYCPMG